MARATAAQEIALMKQRMDSMEDKGVVSRVNINTSARLTMQKALWTLWTVVIGSLVAYFFSNNG